MIGSSRQVANRVYYWLRRRVDDQIASTTFESQITADIWLAVPYVLKRTLVDSVREPVTRRLRQLRRHRFW